MFVDTHCHIQLDYSLDSDEVLETAEAAGVGAVVCVGCTARDSEAAVDFARQRARVFAAVGVHPHEILEEEGKLDTIEMLASDENVVAIGEIGLDYFYEKHPRDLQRIGLRKQLDIAKQVNKPVMLHVRGSKDNPRDAFDDFFEMYDEYKLPGLVHSFSGSREILNEILKRGLFVGVNGIVTFMKEGEQLDAIRKIPLNRMVLETDAPLLTPVPFRGTINEPKHIVGIANFLAEVRGESVEEIEKATTENAKKLLSLAI